MYLGTKEVMSSQPLVAGPQWLVNISSLQAQQIIYDSVTLVKTAPERILSCMR